MFAHGKKPTKRSLYKIDFTDFGPLIFITRIAGS